MAGNFERMLDYYPLLIECAIDFKIESRKILAARSGQEPEITEDVETCTVAEGYTIVKHNNKFFCLKEGQSLEERIREKRSVSLKPTDLEKLQKDGSQD